MLDCIVQTTNNAIEKVENFAVELNIPYILGVNNALLGYVFTNFGKWKVLDPDGENLVNGYISSISKKDDFTLLKLKILKNCLYQIH